MSNEKLTFSDLGFGFLNDVRDNSANSFDRRRSNAFDYWRSAVQHSYDKNTLANINSFRGFVIHVSKKNGLVAGQKDAVLKKYIEKGAFDKLGSWLRGFAGIDPVNVYKVYIPELECRPAPMSYTDPVVETYYDVYESDAVKGREIKRGSKVTVTWENLFGFVRPMITEVGETIAFEEIELQSAITAHAGATPLPLEMYGSTPYTPAPPPPSAAPAEVIEESVCYDTANIPNKSQHSEILRGLHPDFLPYVKTFICKCWEKQIKIQLNSGYRSAAHQRRLYAQWEAGGRRGPAPSSGMSYHNFGMAFDFNPTLADGTTLTSRHPKGHWHQSGIVEIGESVGLYWGGNFSTNFDPIHWDFRNTLKRNERVAFVNAAAVTGTALNRQPMV